MVDIETSQDKNGLKWTKNFPISGKNPIFSHAKIHHLFPAYFEGKCKDENFLGSQAAKGAIGEIPRFRLWAITSTLFCVLWA
jgi:hypothetical protein